MSLVVRGSRGRYGTRIARAGANVSGAAVPTFMYVYGGNSGGRLDTAEKYAVDTWTSIQDLTNSRQGHCVVGIDGNNYLCAGSIGAGDTRDCVEYSVSGDSYAAKADMPVPVRNAPCASAIGSFGYVCGGSNAGAYLQDCDRYSPGGNSWVNMNDMPVPGRVYAESATADNVVYVCGGYFFNGGGNFIQDCDSFDGTNWTNETDIDAPGRYLFALATIGSKVYAHGGQDSVGARLADNDEYTPSTSSWAGRTALDDATNNLASSELGGAIYTTGGQRAAGLTVDTDEYVVDTWTDRGALNGTRISFDAATA